MDEIESKLTCYLSETCKYKNWIYNKLGNGLYFFEKKGYFQTEG